MGGGSSSGSYPSYISSTQEAWLRGTITGDSEIDEDMAGISMTEQLINVLANNPYDNAAPTGLFFPSNAGDLRDSIGADADSNVSTADAYDAENDFDDAVSAVQAAINTAMDNPGADSTNLKDHLNVLVNAAIVQAGNVITDTHDLVKPIIQNDFATLLATSMQWMNNVVVANVGQSTTFPVATWNKGTTDMDELITSVLETVNSNADAVIDATIVKALALIADASGQISSDVDAFEARTISRHMNGVGRFAGQMASMNASMTSSFAQGISMMEIDRGKEVSEYEANVKSELMKSVLQTYPTLANGNTGTLLSAYRDTMQQRIDVFKTELGHRVENTIKTLMANTARVDAMQKDIVDTAQALAKDQESAFMMSYSQVQAARNSYILGMTQMITQAKFNGTQQQINAKTSRQDAQRMMYVINKEYNDEVLERRVLRGEFPLQVYSHAGNLLASSSGAAVLPKGPSKMASALSGAMGGAGSGALTGAAIGAAGGPIGATGGAAIGLAGGFLSGLMS